MVIALLDACVLYPPSLRDLLMRVATVGVYEPRLTEEIHVEWIRNVLADNPQVTPARLDRTRRLMNQVTEKCLVSGYKTRLSSLNLPDPNDRHVLAAAIEATAEVIVTYNLPDFPDTILRAYNIAAVHPDDFLSALFDSAPELFLQGVRAHRASLRNPPKDVEAYLQTLLANRLTELAHRLSKDKDKL